MKLLPAAAEWLPKYELRWLSKDLVAGATVWAVLIPTTLAYANLVGVDPLVGLYTVPAALFAYAIFGGSKLLVVGADASVAVISGTVIAAVALQTTASNLELAIALTLAVGLVYVAFAVLRLGWVTDLLPDPVIKGVVEGIVWLTILKQIGKLLGLKASGAGETFFPKLVETFQALPDLNVLTTVLGVGSLLALFVLHRVMPRIPSPLLVLLASIVLIQFTGLADRGVSVIGSPEPGGALDSSQSLSYLEAFVLLIPGAFAVVLIGATLSIAAAKRAAETSGESINPDREFLALGAANLGSGLSGAYPVAGALSKTAAAMQAGGKTQIGNCFTAVLGVITIVALVPLFELLADAVLAAIVIFVMLEVSDTRYFARLWRQRRVECIVGIIALAGVLVYGPLMGVAIGVALALVVLSDHIRRPPTAIIGRTETGHFAPIEEARGAEEIPGLVIWRHYGPLVFINARRLASELEGHVALRPGTRVVVIDASATSIVDSTATTAFLAAKRDLESRGVELWVARGNEANWQRIVASLESQDIQIPRAFDSVRDAAAAFDSFVAAGTSRNSVELPPQ
jgi:high affinity sulfate transporter 1